MAENRRSWSSPLFNVRGHTAYQRPATLSARSGAALIDLSLIWMLSFRALGWLDIPPVPHPAWIAIVVFWVLIVWILPVSCLGNSPGELLWLIRIKAPEQANRPQPRFLPQLVNRLSHGKLVQPSSFEPLHLLTALFLTALGTTAFGWSLQEVFFESPYWQSAEVSEYAPFLPVAENAGGGMDSRWSVTPFFYTLGAWPRLYGEHPVFYSLPYEKGPPTKFIGHIIARWAAPDIRVTFEGPRSPQPPIAQKTVRRCFTGDLSLRCLERKEIILSRHIDEMKAIHPAHWSVRWVQVSNPAIPSADQTQGIYLSAWNSAQFQDRFIAVTAKGTQQSFQLDGPMTDEGRAARELFEKSIRSLRVSDELAPSRVWVDHALQEVRLDDLQKSGETEDPARFLERITDVQTLLISKISVDPKSFEAYYHLAGTTLLVTRLTARQSSRQEAWSSLLSNWGGIAKALVLSSFRYGQDVGGEDPRVKQLESFWIEVQKL